MATPALSTGIDNDTERLAIRRIAQQLAVAQYRYQSQDAPGSAPTGRLDSGGGSRFEVHDGGVDSSAITTKPAARAGVQELFTGAEAMLPQLFEERARRGDQPGQSRSQFWIGLDSMRKAQADGDAKAARKAAEKHISHVARILGKGVHADVSERGFSLGFEAIAAGSATLATSTWAWLPAFQALISSASVLAPAAAIAAGTALPRWRATRRRASALIDIIDL